MTQSYQHVKQAVVSSKDAEFTDRNTMRLVLFNEDGTPLDISGGSGAVTGADVVLTGYTAGSAGNVAATDTVNAAIAKLEARIAALETV